MNTSRVLVSESNFTNTILGRLLTYLHNLQFVKDGVVGELVAPILHFVAAIDKRLPGGDRLARAFLVI